MIKFKTIVLTKIDRHTCRISRLVNCASVKIENIDFRCGEVITTKMAVDLAQFSDYRTIIYSPAAAVKEPAAGTPTTFGACVVDHLLRKNEAIGLHRRAIMGQPLPEDIGKSFPPQQEIVTIDRKGIAKWGFTNDVIGHIRVLLAGRGGVGDGIRWKLISGDAEKGVIKFFNRIPRLFKKDAFINDWLITVKAKAHTLGYLVEMLGAAPLDYTSEIFSERNAGFIRARESVARAEALSRDPVPQNIQSLPKDETVRFTSKVNAFETGEFQMGPVVFELHRREHTFHTPDMAADYLSKLVRNGASLKWNFIPDKGAPQISDTIPRRAMVFQYTAVGGKPVCLLHGAFIDITEVCCRAAILLTNRTEKANAARKA